MAIKKDLFRLTNLDLDEVSLVLSGDDGMAKVLLAKTEPVILSDNSEIDMSNVIINRNTGGSSVPQAKDGDIIDKSGLPDDVREYIELLEDAVLSKVTDDENEDGADDENDVDNAEVDQEDEDEDEADEATPPKVKKEDKPVVKSTQEVLSKADPEVRALILKMQADQDASNARLEEAEAIAKSERSQRVEREWIAKASTLDSLPTNANELGALLHRLHDVAPKETAAVEKLLKATNAIVGKSTLYNEIGKAGITTTASTTVEGKAAELRKSDPTMTVEQSIAKAYRANPDLYDEDLNERTR